MASRLSDWISLGALASWVPRDEIEGAVEAAGKTARRRGGKLPPQVMVYFVMGLALCAEEDCEEVWAKITETLTDRGGFGGDQALVTAGALHVQKDTARCLVEEKKAGCLFTAVKENQPGLFAVLDALARENAPVVHVMQDKGHGRHETRTIQVLPAPAAASCTSPQVAAAIRNTVIAALRLAGFTGTAAGRRWAARNPARPLAVLNLTLPQSRRRRHSSVAHGGTSRR